MNGLLSRLFAEMRETIQRPRRLLNLGDRRKLRDFARSFSPSHRNARWQSSHLQGFRVKTYKTYEDYLQHQKSKLGVIGPSGYLAEYDQRFSQALRDRLDQDRLLGNGMTVLCLGARLGSEVKVFLALGCFAVGIDVNPGRENKYVVYGDFHELQFPAGSVDVVFTNSLDHALDIERVIREITRVLKPGGLLIVEAIRGEEEGQAPGSYEAFFWSTLDHLVALVEHGSFTLVLRKGFDYPCHGEHLCFRKTETA